MRGAPKLVAIETDIDRAQRRPRRRDGDGLARLRELHGHVAVDGSEHGDQDSYGNQRAADRAHRALG